MAKIATANGPRSRRAQSQKRTIKGWVRDSNTGAPQRGEWEVEAVPVLTPRGKKWSLKGQDLYNRFPEVQLLKTEAKFDSAWEAFDYGRELLNRKPVSVEARVRHYRKRKVWKTNPLARRNMDDGHFWDHYGYGVEAYLSEDYGPLRVNKWHVTIDPRYAASDREAPDGHMLPLIGGPRQFQVEAKNLRELKKRVNSYIERYSPSGAREQAWISGPVGKPNPIARRNHHLVVGEKVKLSYEGWDDLKNGVKFRGRWKRPWKEMTDAERRAWDAQSLGVSDFRSKEWWAQRHGHRQADYQALGVVTEVQSNGYFIRFVGESWDAWVPDRKVVAANSTSRKWPGNHYEGVDPYTAHTNGWKSKSETAELFKKHGAKTRYRQVAEEMAGKRRRRDPWRKKKKGVDPMAKKNRRARRNPRGLDQRAVRKVYDKLYAGGKEDWRLAEQVVQGRKTFEQAEEESANIAYAETGVFHTLYTGMTKHQRELAHELPFSMMNENPRARRNMAIRRLPGGGYEADTVKEMVEFEEAKSKSAQLYGKGFAEHGVRGEPGRHKSSEAPMTGFTPGRRGGSGVRRLEAQTKALPWDPRAQGTYRTLMALLGGRAAVAPQYRRKGRISDQVILMDKGITYDQAGAIISDAHQKYPGLMQSKVAKSGYAYLAVNWEYLRDHPEILLSGFGASRIPVKDISGLLAKKNSPVAWTRAYNNPKLVPSPFIGHPSYYKQPVGAGQYLPEMYPYGVNGRPATYAIAKKNSGDFGPFEFQAGSKKKDGVPSWIDEESGQAVWIYKIENPRAVQGRPRPHSHKSDPVSPRNGRPGYGEFVYMVKIGKYQPYLSAEEVIRQKALGFKNEWDKAALFHKEEQAVERAKTWMRVFLVKMGRASEAADRSFELEGTFRKNRSRGRPPHRSQFLQNPRSGRYSIPLQYPAWEFDAYAPDPKLANWTTYPTYSYEQFARANSSTEERADAEWAKMAAEKPFTVEELRRMIDGYNRRLPVDYHSGGNWERTLAYLKRAQAELNRLLAKANPQTLEGYEMHGSGPRGGYTKAERAAIPRHMFLEPNKSPPSFPVSDRNHAWIAVQYMTRFHIPNSPTLIRRLAKFWPPSDRKNAEIWARYKRLRPKIAKMAGVPLKEMPTITQLKGKGRLTRRARSA